MDLSPETIPEEHVSQKENIIKAIVGDTYGSPDVLELRDIDKPEISDDEVLVRVHTAGVDRGVWHLMTGLPYVARLAPEHKLVHKPANLTFEQAAVLAISSLTALQGLRDHGKVESGQEVLIIGASGGVGTYAVQIARAFGARVTGVCGTARVEMVHRRGSRHRQDVPARRGPRGHPLSRRRTGQRKSRHQRVTVNRA